MYDSNNASFSDVNYLIWDLYSLGITSRTKLDLKSSKNVDSGVPDSKLPITAIKPLLYDTIVRVLKSN